MPPLRLARRRPCRVAAGFSLIELLMASLILALGASLLSGVLLSANRSADLRRQQLIAAQLAAAALAQIDATPEPGDISDTLERNAETYTTATRITALPAADGHLLQARTVVAGPFGTTAMTTLRMPPPAEDP